MRGWVALGALVLLFPLAAAHDAPHGLHVTDVHFTVRAPGAYQEVRFVVHNSEDSVRTEELRAAVSFVYTLDRVTYELPQLEPGTAVAVILKVPGHVAPYGCVQAFEVVESSDAVCAATSGVGVG